MPPFQKWTSLVVQLIKNPPAMQETLFRFPGQEDPLEKGMATYPSLLAWKIPWTEEPGGLRSLRLQRVRYNWSDLAHTRILEWVAYPISSGSSQPRNWTRVSCIAGGFFTNWAIREAPAHTQAQSNKNKIVIPWLGKYELNQVKQVSFMKNYTQILIY